MSVKDGSPSIPEAERFRSLLSRALVEVRDLKTRLEAKGPSGSEPIAVIGMGCRFPGAPNPEALWALLSEGRDAVGDVPADRWDVPAHYSSDRDAAGKMYTRRGNFLDRIDGFDAPFFRITPREADRMDPQQRLLLEVSWEALEDAGLAADRLGGSATGVFVGISGNEYAQLGHGGDLSAIDVYSGSGNVLSVAAGRLSYVYGFQGPAMALDTACSSSLVALHLACQSLREGESSLALAAGVSLILSPESMVSLCRSRALSPDGTCKTFDAAADGYGRGEGCGVLVLERLADARAAGHHVLGLVRGTAVNHDGRSSALSVPNGPAQESVIREALRRAGVDAKDVGYVEAHGTGTALGDPIELRALGNVLGEGRAPDRPFLVGSVKTNIGHLEASAGVAGVIKVLLALRHETVPAHLHLGVPNPHVAWDEIPARVPGSPVSWTSESGPRLAGVSAFGYSGTNAHVVLQEAPPRVEAPAFESRARLLVLSARDPEALRQLAGKYQDLLASPGASVADIARSAATGRSRFAHRLALVSDDGENAAEMAVALSARASHRVSIGVAGRDTPRVAFLFTGQGSVYSGMASGLHRTEPVFRDSLDRCARILTPHLDRPLLELLEATDGSLSETLNAQPALFALGFSLCELWRSWGIVPSVVMGHSVGELAAACVAGFFSLEDGLVFAAERGRLMQESARGAMAAIFADESRVAAALPRGVSIAASNGPLETVISGETSAVEAALVSFGSAGVRGVRLEVTRGFHSALMDPVLQGIESTAARMALTPGRIPLITNVTGTITVEGELTNPQFFSRHARQAVRFSEGMRALERHGVDVILEIGPSAVLSALGRRCLPDSKAAWLHSLRPGKNDLHEMLFSLGALWVKGAPADPAAVQQPAHDTRVELPTYPFQRTRHWVTPPEARPRAVESRSISELPVRVATFPLLGDHRVYGKVIVPASFHLAILGAALDRAGDTGRVLHDVTFPEPLPLGDDESATLQASASGSRWSVASGSGSIHITARTAAIEKERASVYPLEELRFRCPDVRPGSEFYAAVDRLEVIQLGPRFRFIEEARCGQGEALCRLRAVRPEEIEPALAFPPGLLDSCFQALNAALPGTWLSSGSAGATAYVPLAIERFRFEQIPIGRPLWAHARIEPAMRSTETLTGTIRLLDGEGRCVVEVEGLVVKRATREAILATGRAAPLDGPSAYTVVWHARPLRRLEGSEGAQSISNADAATDGTVAAGAAQATASTGASVVTVESLAFASQPAATPIADERPWLLLADTAGLASALAKRLGENGVACVLGAPGTEPPGPEIVPDFAGVVDLRGLDADAERDPLGLASSHRALGLVQTLVARRRSGPSRLILVTRGAQPVGSGTSVATEQASLWGLARVVAVEHPELDCRSIDLDPAGEAMSGAELLLDEMFAPDGEERVAFRRGERSIARLVAVPPGPTPGPVSLRGDATYLITGGLGALGLHVVAWAVARGAQSLVLASRSRATPDTESRLDELRRSGARIEVFRSDVSRRDEVAALLARIASDLAPLAGVFHLAGVLDDGVLSQQTARRIESVFAPKAGGAWHLHELTKDLSLAHFVLFSSVASLLGSGGQAGYAMANAFLDALAHRRRSLGLPATVLDWGPWSGGGMAASRTGRGGPIEALAPDEALVFLDRALVEDSVQLAVLGRMNRGSSRSPFLSALGGPGGRATTEGRTSTTGVDREATLLRELKVLEGAPRELRHERLVQGIAGIAARVVGLDDAALDRRQPLSEQGFDSLMSLELRNALGENLDRSFPVTILFDFPTLESLAEEIGTQLWPHQQDAPVPRSGPASEREFSPTERIAIIGMGCRFPGGANDPEAYWSLLERGGSGISEVPADRWDVDAYFDADPAAPGKMSTRFAGFLKDVDVAGFDAPFFGIAPREAVSMDPQQRLLLEVAWEALEDAAIPPDSLARSATGVFIGIGGSDYAQVLTKNGALDGIDAYSGTGTVASVAAGRISYVLDLKGPNFPIDTACSSSLVALHVACQSLRSGESNLALAGGVNLMLAPAATIYFSKLRVLAPDGRCKTFDRKADGYARGEGAGILVLKRLSEAERDGDRILAVVRGSAVSHDGRSNGLTAPNARAQEAVLRQALHAASLEPGDVGFIEAHGTGTALGDPIEMKALRAVFGPGRDVHRPLFIGTAKTNIGHLEAAAGVAGLIKAVLALRHGVVPAHLNFDELSPLISMDGFAATIPTTRTEWASAGRRVAGVSSFGFSGTNAHVVLESAPDSAEFGPARDSGEQLLVLSARTEPALRALAGRYGESAALADDSFGPALADVARTSREGRSHFKHRAAITGSSKAEIRAKLEALASREPVSEAWIGIAREPAPAISGETSVDAAAEIYLRGAHPRLFAEPVRRRPVSLPKYPWQRNRYWTAGTEGARMSHEEKTGTNVRTVTSATTAPTAPTGRVERYYDLVAGTADAEQGMPVSERFAPFPAIVPGFSWLRTVYQPERHPEHLRLVLDAQRTYRETLFAGIEFSSIVKALDIGCGNGTDLLALARENPHLRLDGYNVSGGEAELCNRKVATAGLGDRVRVYHRDSVTDEFPDRYDLVFGFQVVHNIEIDRRARLFDHIGRHLQNGGVLLLGDYIAATGTPIEQGEARSSIATFEQWLLHLSMNRLRVTKRLDIGREVGNFFFDPDFDRNLAEIADALALDPLLVTGLKMYDALGTLLRKGLVSYVLLTVQMDRYLTVEEIRRLNRVALRGDVPSMDASRASSVREGIRLAPGGDRRVLMEAYLLGVVSRVLGLADGELGVDAPLDQTGIDSLMAVELQGIVETDLELPFPAAELLSGSGVSRLAASLLERLAGESMRGEHATAAVAATEEEIVL